MAGEEAACLPEADEEVGFTAFLGTGLLAIQPASTETTRTDASLQNFNRFGHKKTPARLNVQIEETLFTGRISYLQAARCFVGD